MDGTGPTGGRAAARSALAIWWASRAGLFVAVIGVSYVLALPAPQRIRGVGGWLLERFVWWDSFHFLRIADRGYLPPELPCCDQVFFPAYPFATRAASLLTGGNLVLAGLLVTQVAASAAVVLLWLVAVQPGSRAEGGWGRGRAAGPAVGRAAVVLLAVTPFGVFLSSVYSEALFLALTLAAWLAGLRRRWWWAGVFAAGAAATRINGLFLAAALAVMYLAQLRSDGRRRPRLDGLALAVPLFVVAAYFAYLHARTGAWDDWLRAQSLSWHRQSAWPWQGLAAGWRQLVAAPSHDLVISRAADLGTAVAGLFLTAGLLWRRRWAEAVYVGLNLAVLISSNMLVSTPRYALTWFPAYLMAARVAVRPGVGRWILPAAVTLGPATMVVVSVTFAMHLWVA
ncbi:MAG TPA: mannosyltransferase family protein [Kineosporiaceae bacterium]